MTPQWAFFRPGTLPGWDLGAGWAAPGASDAQPPPGPPAHRGHRTALALGTHRGWGGGPPGAPSCTPGAGGGGGGRRAGSAGGKKAPFVWGLGTSPGRRGGGGNLLLSDANEMLKISSAQRSHVGASPGRLGGGRTKGLYGAVGGSEGGPRPRPGAPHTLGHPLCRGRVPGCHRPCPKPPKPPLLCPQHPACRRATEGGPSASRLQPPPPAPGLTAAKEKIPRRPQMPDPAWSVRLAPSMGPLSPRRALSWGPGPGPRPGAPGQRAGPPPGGNTTAGGGSPAPLPPPDTLSLPHSR